MVEVKVVVSIVIMVNLRIEIHKNIHITMFIEPRGKYGAKGIQLPYLVFLTQGKELMYVVINDMHVTKLTDYKVNTFNWILVHSGTK